MQGPSRSSGFRQRAQTPAERLDFEANASQHDAADGSVKMRERRTLPKQMIKRDNEHGDKPLGMEQGITRRDFLNSTLLASGALLLAPLTPAELLAKAEAQGGDWSGPGGVGDYADSNGNTLPVLTAGH